MKKDEPYVIRLRDCFTSGYTLPQFCIDNGIKKPLFVSEEKFLQFAWELYVQFKFDKRILAQFAFINLPSDKINFSKHNILAPLKYKNFSETNLDDFDKIILLTTKDVEVAADKKISLNALTTHLIQMTFAEIPVLKFLQRYPQVKLFYTIFPRDLNRYEGGEKLAETFVRHQDIAKEIKRNKGKIIPTPLDKLGYSNQDFLEMSRVSLKTLTNLDGTTILEDNAHPLANVVNGKRVTAAQPEKFLNRIFFVGACHFTGVLAPFDKTIESYLQKLLNENNLPYRAENEGQRYA